jgi:hypothetical protein
VGRGWFRAPDRLREPGESFAGSGSRQISGNFGARRNRRGTLAKWGVRTYALVARAPGNSWIDHVLDYSMDYRVFAYLVAISVGTGLLFGLAPASRLSRLDVNAALKDGSRGATGRRTGIASIGAAGDRSTTRTWAFKQRRF